MPLSLGFVGTLLVIYQHSGQFRADNFLPRPADLVYLPDVPLWHGKFATVSSGWENCVDAKVQYTTLVWPTFVRLRCAISVFAIN